MCISKLNKIEEKGIKEDRADDTEHDQSGDDAEQDAEEPAGQGDRRQQGVPGQGDAAAVLHGGHAGAPDRGALVGAKQRGRVGVWKGCQQGRHQNQAAAAHNRIDKTGQQRGQRDNKHFHGGIVASGPRGVFAIKSGAAYA